MIQKNLVLVHQTDCPGVTNLKLVTTNHGRQVRGSPSIGNSLPTGVSAQTAVKTLSGWSGEIRGEIAVKLSLAALPLRTRPDFETSRVLCGLAQNYFWGVVLQCQRIRICWLVQFALVEHLDLLLNNSWLETNRSS
ncbi:hypothetical protein [Lapidilactobacillus achengensis]|uniref:hypothetical protein n=1 Tax=Lapidilactobacillus achengensis TaxID=2486000 RepID=UPI000F77D572|nr:hypothetical protein [Lapidilactobacillus achengensis]